MSLSDPTSAIHCCEVPVGDPRRLLQVCFVLHCLLPLWAPSRRGQCMPRRVSITRAYYYISRPATSCSIPSVVVSVVCSHIRLRMSPSTATRPQPDTTQPPASRFRSASWQPQYTVTRGKDETKGPRPDAGWRWSSRLVHAKQAVEGT